MSAAISPAGSRKRLGKLAIGALGVVYGDIGTSPLYAVQECFAHGLTPDPANILGVISLIIWGLTIVVSIKYAQIVMRANYHGEGGVLSLLALALRASRNVMDCSGKGKDFAKIKEKKSRAIRGIMLIGMIGAALFFGDSVVTPAISVLSAVEGMNVALPNLNEFVIPITVTILVSLFAFQRFGSQSIGDKFGLLMMLWFSTLVALGVPAIIKTPQILNALNPIYAIQLLQAHGSLAFVILGAALLAFTGGEALYADMGHFGPRSIRLAWYSFVFPALAINYLGQGALLITNPDAISNPFYLMTPKAMMIPMIVLASIATIIASQAVISGTFSIVQQAIHMDYLPRFSVIHTSVVERGQIYLPKVNFLLCLGVIVLVMLFRSSNALAAAYGFAVSGTMLMTTILTGYVARRMWRWPQLLIMAVFVPIMLFDATFFAAATTKIPEGGWLPLGIGVAILTIFITWREGHSVVQAIRRGKYQSLETFMQTITPEWPKRAPGTSIYLTSSLGSVPSALANTLNRYHTMREHVVILQTKAVEEAYVDEDKRAVVESLGKGFFVAVLHYGYMEQPEVGDDLREALHIFPEVNLDNATYFVRRSIFVEGPNDIIKPVWRKKLFLWLSNNLEEDMNFSYIPADQLVQIGNHIKV